MYLTVSEFSRLTGMNRKTIYRMCSENRVPHYRVGNKILLKMEDFKHGVSGKGRQSL